MIFLKSEIVHFSPFTNGEGVNEKHCECTESKCLLEEASSRRDSALFIIVIIIFFLTLLVCLKLFVL